MLLSLNPDLAEVHNNLGNAFKEMGQLDEAVGAFNRALALDPNLPEALNNLGVILCGKGDAGQGDCLISARVASASPRLCRGERVTICKQITPRITHAEN